MQKNIVVFEVEGGNDKGPDGHRKDTMPIVNAIKAHDGWDSEVIYYDNTKADEIFEKVSKTSGGYISRVNPGNIPGGEKGYFELLTRLSDAGLVGMSSPEKMMDYGAKDALVKLNDTSLVPSDTAAYYDVESFHETFPKSLSYGERVLKQNRGSTGSGIWRVRIEDKDLADSVEPGTALPLDTMLVYTEAVDNHTEHKKLGEFMDFCDQYIVGDNGMLVDMRFMPRIVEGEIRILLVGDKPVFVVHKKPAAGGENFSATLFSGAQYTYDKPEEWQDLIDEFAAVRPVIADKLGGDGNVPLIWTADFMLDDGEDGEDTYVLGEINCSCVGFTSELDMGIQEMVADEAIRRVEEANA
ncbi:MAG: Cj0069 family protein [Corynebacterium kroppenstedtii]|nr:Cj0069 family protein [Corynebacterium kroppenstedtii]